MYTIHELFTSKYQLDPVFPPQAAVLVERQLLYRAQMAAVRP